MVQSKSIQFLVDGKKVNSKKEKNGGGYLFIVPGNLISFLIAMVILELYLNFDSESEWKFSS